MLMLRPLGNRQFSRVPYGTAQSEQATAASQWAKAHIDRNAGRVYTRQDSARSSWRAIGPRTSSANTRRRGIWVERRDTKWRTRPALLCTSSLVRWKSEKRRVEGTFGKKKKKKENTMRSWRYMTDSARAANKQTHHTFQRRLQVRKQLTDCTSFQRTMRAHQRLASYVARHHGLPAT